MRRKDPSFGLMIFNRKHKTVKFIFADKCIEHKSLNENKMKGKLYNHITYRTL